VELKDLQNAFRGCFSFATYLAFSVRASTEDVICLSTPSMIGILLTQGIKAAISYATRGEIVQFHLLCTAISWAFLLALRLFVAQCSAALDGDARAKRRLKGFVRTGHPLLEKFNVEVTLLRILQFLMFYETYNFAGRMVKTSSWAALLAGDVYSIVIVSAQVATLLIMSLALPRLVPSMASMMALPPFFNHTDHLTVLQVMVAGGATGACWAPVVDEYNVQMVRAVGREGILAAVRGLVEGAEPMLHDMEEISIETLGPKTAAEEMAVVDSFMDLLSCTWQDERHGRDADLDTVVAERLQKLHNILKREILRTPTAKRIQSIGYHSRMRFMSPPTGPSSRMEESVDFRVGGVEMEGGQEIAPGEQAMAEVAVELPLMRRQRQAVDSGDFQL